MIASPRDTPSYGMGRHHSTMNICLRLIGCAETQPLKRNILPVSKTPSDRFLKYFLDSCLLLSAEERTSQNSGKTVAELELSWHALLRRSTMDDQKRILLVSRDVIVLQTRKLMLGAYFDVCAAGRVLEAKTYLAERPFDLIVLCYTLTDDDCEKILHAARLHSPRARTLMLTVPGYAAAHLPVDSYFLPADQGPFILVKKSAELLGFEFRSKGRMVRAPQPSVVAQVSHAVGSL
jgi:hypothetical protein